MDRNQKQKSLTHQFMKSQFLKRDVTKLILSVSVFSLFFSHSTLLSFLHYFNLHLSTLPFKLFSHTLDKNCTFLICNGLLVFLAKYSGLFSLSSSSSSPSPSPSSSKHNLKDHNESFMNYEEDTHPQITIMETKYHHHHHHHHQVQLLEEEAELENTQTQQKQNPMQPENEKEKSEAVDTETENSIEENHEEQEEEEEEEEEERAVLGEAATEAEAEADSETGSSFFIEENDDEEEHEEVGGGGGNGKLSDEELNKKFDDFIRKMKEELRIEARQKLIMV